MGSTPSPGSRGWSGCGKESLQVARSWATLEVERKCNHFWKRPQVVWVGPGGRNQKEKGPGASMPTVGSPVNSMWVEGHSKITLARLCREGAEAEPCAQRAGLTGEPPVWRPRPQHLTLRLWHGQGGVCGIRAWPGSPRRPEPSSRVDTLLYLVVSHVQGLCSFRTASTPLKVSGAQGPLSHGPGRDTSCRGSRWVKGQFLGGRGEGRCKPQGHQ